MSFNPNYRPPLPSGQINAKPPLLSTRPHLLQHQQPPTRPPSNYAAHNFSVPPPNFTPIGGKPLLPMPLTNPPPSHAHQHHNQQHSNSTQRFSAPPPIWAQSPSSSWPSDFRGHRPNQMTRQPPPPASQTYPGNYGSNDANNTHTGVWQSGSQYSHSNQLGYQRGGTGQSESRVGGGGSSSGDSSHRSSNYHRSQSHSSSDHHRGRDSTQSRHDSSARHTERDRDRDRGSRDRRGTSTRDSGRSSTRDSDRSSTRDSDRSRSGSTGGRNAERSESASHRSTADDQRPNSSRDRRAASSSSSAASAAVSGAGRITAERDELLTKWRSNYCEHFDDVKRKLAELHSQSATAAADAKVAWVRSSPSDVYYQRLEGSVVKSTSRLDAVCELFETDLMKRSARIRAKLPPYTAPTRRRRHKVCRHKCKRVF